ncbi:MAG: ABC transporter permease [Granulosicoccus sp.]
MKKSSGLFAVAWRVPLIVWQITFFVVPLGFLIYLSFWVVENYRMTPALDPVNWDKMLSRDYFWSAYFYTFKLALVATVLTSLIAFPAACALAFKLSPATRRFVLFLLVIPFFTSYLVRIYAWQSMLAESGIINVGFSFLGIGPFSLLNSAVGTMVGYLALTLPLVTILQTLSLANIDKRLVEAAYNLGCGKLRVIVSVIIPLARVGIIVGALFCFILSFGDFVSPYYLGGSKPPTLSILIVDTTKAGQQWPRAAVVAIIMIGTLFLIALASVAFAYRRPKT